MNTEERQLSEWLHARTPEPPRRLLVEDITGRGTQVRDLPVRRRWMPMLAAACVVLLAGAIALIVSRNAPHRSAPVSSPTVPAPKITAPSPTTSSVVPAGTRVGPWGASTLGGQAAHSQPLAGQGDSLYVNDGNAILRLDAATGSVLARRSYPAGAPRQALIVAHTLWITEPGATLTVRGLDLNTLTPIAAITIPGPGLAKLDQPPFEANARDNRLYLAVNNTVTVIDATTDQIAFQYTVTGAPIADLAINPDDTRLYVTSNTPNTATVNLAVLNPDTGAALIDAIHYDGGTGFDGISASAGGIWLETGSGIGTHLSFHPATNLTATGGATPPTGGGGYPVTSTIADNVVWLGGTSNLACANPLTGNIRATAVIPTPHNNAANIANLTVAGNQLFAYYQAGTGPAQLLIKLNPPAQCTG